MMPKRAMSVFVPSFERETIQWRGAIYRMAVALTRNRADAEDLVQDTYFLAYRYWHTFLPGSNARAWLRAVCRNVFLRNRKRFRPVIHAGGDLESMASRVQRESDPPTSAEDVVVQRDMARAVRDAIQQLAEPYRSTIMLVDVEDQPYEVAASMLGVPLGTVRSRLFRARRQIRSALSNQPLAPPQATHSENRAR
jgi:RNA polymerase sigma-70 factor, ECF subfamily